MRVTKNNTVLVRFTQKGRWAEELNVSSEQFDVVSGQQRMVSMVLGDIIVKSGKGEYVDPDSTIRNPGPKHKKQTGPIHKKQTGPAPKAEAR